jgi:hypothetical protein
MEIAVILAAGLRDWIDFGVIVSLFLPEDMAFLSDRVISGILDWYLVP